MARNHKAPHGVDVVKINRNRTVPFQTASQALVEYQYSLTLGRGVAIMMRQVKYNRELQSCKMKGVR